MGTSVVFRILSKVDIRRMTGGRRRLLAPLRFEYRGKEYEIPEGFTTDYSSWPKWLPWGPRWDRIDLAGIIHDWLWKHAHWPEDEARVGYWKGNKVWYDVARAGDGETSAGPFWSVVGYAGLTLGGWWSWARYRLTE